MNNFRKGNDLIVKWAIKYSDGTPFPLENYAWELCYSAGRGINVVKDTAVISVSDNLLTWRFSGKDQAFYGKYSLTLRLYQQGKIVATVSKNNAFELSTTQYDGPCDIDLVSYCDNISLQDALLRGNKAMDVAQDAKTTSQGAKTIATEAKTLATEAKSNSTQAVTTANTAKTTADQAKVTADTTAATATQKAEEVAQKEAQLEAALNNLSTDQSGALALSTKVNEHGEKLSELDNEVFGEKFNFIAEYTQASGYQYFPITLKPNVNYSVTKSEDVVDVQLKSDTANVISLKTLNSFTLTEEEASLITQLSLYKGTVSINADIGESIEQKLGEKADKIEVETPDGKVNNLSTDVTIIKDSMLVEEYEDANPTISNGYRSTSGSIYSDGENFAELAVSEGEKLLLYSSGTGINASFPTAYYWNNGAYKNTIFVTDKIENVEIVVPSGVDTLYVNSTKKDISIKKKVKKPVIDNIRQDVTEIDGSIKNISHNLPNMGKLAFSWKPFDKCYISWNNDDLRTDSYLYKNLCDEFGFPYCVAAPYEVVAKNTQMINGQTPVEFCKSIVANGGEILSHNIKVLTSSSTDEDYNDVFNVSKDTLESAIGCKVRGIILAGGAGYTTVDALKAQGYSMIYYDYSDLYGISPQYHMGRTQTIFESGETDQQLADRMIAKIDDAIANKKWLRMWCHGESEVSIAALRIVFQYIQTKITEGKVEFITWSQGYDKFKPTI